ncbi:MAG: [Lachnospiraceae bacterium]|nr:[FeFe] hydrogenase H-cluster radical SAM maturase HydE [Lachnospiraceae bacterium]
MYKGLIDKLASRAELSHDEYLTLIRNRDEIRDYASALARAARHQYYGDRIYIRGLIEFTNYCKNNCYYCGIRAGNSNVDRYRLMPEDIIACADVGYDLGFRTFVLQGGEDSFYTDTILARIVSSIRKNHADCAITLSLGERSRKSYQILREAGADRYLLRHETCSKTHYETLHPDSMSFERRIQCICDLKELGYQVGVGFMVGSPNQTEKHLAEELLFLKKLKPHMVGIGPFIPHKDTPFRDESGGTSELTTFLLSLIRLTLPEVLLPATTALGTIDPLGRENGIRAGANVLMPNLSPVDVRKKYMLYDNKICTGEEAAQCITCLKNRVRTTGCEIVTDRGDYTDVPCH